METNSISSRTRSKFPTLYERLSGGKYRIFLFIVFLLFWTWAAVDPVYRDGWLLENIPVFIFVPLLVLAGAYFRLSNVSYTLITIFMILHVIGSHYTYAEVPFGYWLEDLLEASRNMYDRLVHFSFGLLFAYPVREVFIRLARAKGVWGYFFPVELTFAASAIYEVIEWGVAVVVSSEAGLAFLGAQGDIWDAQKDMLLAGIGAIIAMTIIFIFQMNFNRDFWRELRRSIRPAKDDRPLGEEEIAKIL